MNNMNKDSELLRLTNIATSIPFSSMVIEAVNLKNKYSKQPLGHYFKRVQNFGLMQGFVCFSILLLYFVSTEDASELVPSVLDDVLKPSYFAIFIVFGVAHLILVTVVGANDAKIPFSKDQEVNWASSVVQFIVGLAVLFIVFRQSLNTPFFSSIFNMTIILSFMGMLIGMIFTGFAYVFSGLADAKQMLTNPKMSNDSDDNSQSLQEVYKRRRI